MFLYFAYQSIIFIPQFITIKHITKLNVPCLLELRNLVIYTTIITIYKVFIKNKNVFVNIKMLQKCFAFEEVFYNIQDYEIYIVLVFSI